MRENYDERLRLYHSGYATVHLRGKIPQCVGWQQRGRSLYNIDEDFGIDPYGNNGVITGEALDGTQFLVLDIDSKELYEEVRQKINTETTIVETRRGFHLWYRGTMGCRQGLGGMKLDVRGRGGYATSPFSRVDGHVYRWVSALREPTKLAEFDPEFLLKLGVQERREPQPKPLSLVSQGTVEWARRVLGEEYYSIEGCGGDLALFKAACFLIQRARLDYRTALQLLMEWNADGVHAIPNWPQKRLEYKLSEAQRLMK